MSGLRIIDEYAEWPKGAALDIAKEICVTRIFEVWEHRGYWSKIPHNDKFSFLFEQAKEHIERHRVKGSFWRIEETPACAFIASDYSLLVVPFGSAFGKYSYNRNINPFLSSIAAAFWGKAFVFLAKIKTLEPVIKNSFRAYYSSSLGGHARLNWNPGKAPRRFRLAQIRNFAAIHQAQLSRPFYGILFEAIGKIVRVRDIHRSSPLWTTVDKGALICDLTLNRNGKQITAFASVENAIKNSRVADQVCFLFIEKRGREETMQGTIWSLPSFNEIVGP